MGCCLAKPQKPDSKPPQTLNPKPEAKQVPVEEEETVVKEVLSETPTPKPPNTKPIPNPIREKPILPQINNNAEVSETSDICSVSKTASTVYSGEFPIHRSPAKVRNRNLSGEFPIRRPGLPKRVGALPNREISSRRSRSPAMRSSENNVARYGSGPGLGLGCSGPGRSPSGRKTGKSPSRVRSEGLMAKRNEESKRFEPKEGDESLENPLVSLECFIFL